MKKFEYWRMSGQNASRENLDRFGDEGWELVAISGSTMFNETYVFKREKIEKVEASAIESALINTGPK